MKKIRRFASSMLAVMLAGTLTVGSMSVSALAAEDAGSVESTSVETSFEEATEEVETGASDAIVSDTSEIATEEEAVTSYTVTLDANGGYFINEWDDILGEYLQKTEVINKTIPIGGTVTTFPVLEKQNKVVTFIGWSFERDGELVSQNYEEYVNFDNSVLYAVWKEEDVSRGNIQSQEHVDEDNDRTFGPPDTGNTEIAKEYDSIEKIKDIQVIKEPDDGYVEEKVGSNSYTIPIAEGDQNSSSANEVIDSDEEKKVIASDYSEGGKESNQTRIESFEEETVKGDAVMGTEGEVVANGTCGDNATWKLVKGEEHYSETYFCTLYIMGTGPMTDWEPYKNQTPWEKYKRNSSKYEINEVVVSEGITTIGNAMLGGTNFDGSTNYRHQFVNKIVLPSTIERIGDYAFSQCDDLSSIKLPNNVTYIGKFAFYACGLEKINFPDKVSFVGEYAFEGSELEEVNIPKSMSVIGESAFYGCKISDLVIPDTVEEIGSKAFLGCNLKEIHIPSSVTYIGHRAFNGGREYLNDTSFRKMVITVDENNKVYDSRNKCNAIIETSTDTLILGCNNTIIPNNILSIGDYAFSDCTHIEKLILPDSLKGIGSYAFQSCDKLTSIMIPPRVKNIGDYAFAYCANLNSIKFTGKSPSILSSAFTDVTATAYYPANDPTWTEDVRKNFGGDITWVPWDIKDPIVTPDSSSFSISIGTAENSAVVIGEDGQTWAVSNYEFSNRETALNEAKDIKWTCSDASAVELYDPVYNLGSDNVRIELSLRGKKPGSYTIIGTAPDGRKASADVVVEPKIVALSDKKEIIDTTDVEMLQVTLSSPDKEYLTSFLNGITCDVKDEYGAIGGAEGKRVEVSDDGKTGKLIYTLTPVYGGNCEFSYKSPGGQKIVETIYSGLNIYPWESVYKITIPGFETTEDVFGFTNSIRDIGVKSGAPYPINKDWGRFFEDNHFTESEVKSILHSSYKFGGVCAGMTSVMMQNYLGLFSPESVQTNAKNLKDISAPSNNSKIQTLLGLNQYCSINDNYHIKQHKFENSYSGKSALQYLYELALHVESTRKPIYVDFCFLKNYDLWKNGDANGAGAHAMLVYGIESNGSYYEIDGKKYKYRVLTINPNYLYTGEDVGEDYCIYISDSFDSCIIPKSGTMQDDVNKGYLRYCGKEDGLKNTNDFYFQYITDDINNLLPSSNRNASETDPYFVVSGVFDGPIIIDEEPIDECKTFVRKVYPPCGSASTVPSYILKKGSYRIKTQGNDNISLSSSDMFVTFDTEDGGSIKLIEDNKVVVNSGGNFSISVTPNDLSVPNDNMTTFSLEGSNASDLEIGFSEDGVVLTGTIEAGTLLKYSSVDDEQECEYKLEKSLSDIVVSVDENISIVYDNNISEGLNISATNILSKASDSISVELNKPSYSVQEGDTLTIEATIKTDKARVVGQNEYIGYFAYYANKQWNQLASWDIEGGATKYTLKLKKEKWEKYGELMFTVSVFPRDSFVQGSALVDNVFLVDVSKKPQEPEEEDEIVDSGSCGNALTWSLDKAGSLVINGTGNMPNWTESSLSPWNKHASEILNVVIGDEVTNIGNYAFYNCKKLKSVSFGNTVQEIGECAFMMTYELNKVSIPDSVRTIKKTAFSCSWIEDLSLGNGIQRIEDDAFGGNFALTKVVFPESLEYLGESVFDGSEFKDIYFCGDAPEMGFSVFVNEEDATVYYPVWSDAWTETLRNQQHWGNITWKTWNPGDKKTISSTTVSLDKTSFIFTGKPVTPSITVKSSGVTLKKNKDYKASYSNNINAGTANVIVTGMGDYYGTITKSFKINPSTISTANVTDLVDETYTGKAITPTPAVEINATTLNLDTDYTLSYENNTNAGTATVTITGKGNYTGTETATFIITKANQSITVKTSASSIAVGKTATVSITGAKGKKSFKSSNTSVATVNASTGVVTGKKAGTVTITATSAATSNYNAASKSVKITVTANKTLKKPGNCRFTKWNNAKYTGCRISWNKVAGAEGYQTLLSWTDGSHSSSTITKANVLYRDCTVHPQHVSQMKVRAFYTSGGKRVYGPWSNVVYITPSPTKLTTKNASTGSDLKMNVSWNIVYGCNGYNVFVTTNPNGKWYWNQSTSEKASATSATITKCGGSKLKKNTRYYVRIVTRRKRNGVFCTVPMPASNTYIGTFTIK